MIRIQKSTNAERVDDAFLTSRNASSTNAERVYHASSTSAARPSRDPQSVFERIARLVKFGIYVRLPFLGKLNLSPT